MGEQSTRTRNLHDGGTRAHRRTRRRTRTRRGTRRRTRESGTRTRLLEQIDRLEAQFKVQS